MSVLKHAFGPGSGPCVAQYKASRLLFMVPLSPPQGRRKIIMISSRYSLRRRSKVCYGCGTCSRIGVRSSGSDLYLDERLETTRVGAGKAHDAAAAMLHGCRQRHLISSYLWSNATLQLYGAVIGQVGHWRKTRHDLSPNLEHRAPNLGLVSQIISHTKPKSFYPGDTESVPPNLMPSFSTTRSEAPCSSSSKRTPPLFVMVSPRDCQVSSLLFVLRCFHNG